MDMKNWCSSGSTRSLRLGRRCPVLEAVNSPAAATRTRRRPVWKQLWRKLLKEKRKMTTTTESSSVRVRVPYDEHTYAQNFDEGLVWDEPDILSRSFSVRFADPSRIFCKKGSDVKDFLDI
ncbi:hypothetical protein U1Q18_028565 [Sarracenia purpurea var. burkii]